MIAPTHNDVVSTVQNKLDNAMKDAIGEFSNDFYLLDFPDHGNVGDSAIWLGEIEWLKHNTRSRPAYFCKHDSNIEDIKANIKGGCILLHGGGNFGDIWPQHQIFRENIIQAFPDNKIIQLPQSIHYDDMDLLTRTSKIINAHKNFTLMVRDDHSLSLAKKNFSCRVIKSPDCAFALGTIERSRTPDTDILFLMRSDKEKSTSEFQHSQKHWSIEDWLEDEEDVYKSALKTTRLEAIKSLNLANLGRKNRTKLYFNCLARNRMNRGIDQLSKAKFIITDRLHVHIVATLMGIPHVFLDNYYGKITRFSDAFQTMWSGNRRATSIEEAIKLVDELRLQTVAPQTP